MPNISVVKPRPNKPKGSNSNTQSPIPNNSAWDFTDFIKVALYGSPGSGKTTLWSTFPSPILALVISGGKLPGELRSINTPENRKRINAQVINKTSDIEYWLKQAKNYKTLVWDHVTGLQDLTLKEVLGIEEIPAQKKWGTARIQDYGECALMCKEFLRESLSIQCNTVIIAQEKLFEADEENNISELITPVIGVDTMPSLGRWINSSVDYILQTFKRPKMMMKEYEINGKKKTKEVETKQIEYCLRCEPHKIVMTKFRVPMEKGKKLPDIIVDPTYEKLLKEIQ